MKIKFRILFFSAIILNNVSTYEKFKKYISSTKFYKFLFEKKNLIHPNSFNLKFIEKYSKRNDDFSNFLEQIKNSASEDFFLNKKEEDLFKEIEENKGAEIYKFLEKNLTINPSIGSTLFFMLLEKKSELILSCISEKKIKKLYISSNIYIEPENLKFLSKSFFLKTQEQEEIIKIDF